MIYHEHARHGAWSVLAILLISILAVMPRAQAQSTTNPSIKVREGFVLTVAVDQIDTPRFMEFGPDGTLYVSVPGQGEIKSCLDKDGDGYFETIRTFVSNYPTVHGMDWHDGWLWFTRSGSIYRARDTDGDGVSDETITVIPEGQLPSGGHWWRPILIHNGRLYTGIGDSGNITDERDTDREKIWTYDLEGKDKRLFISGIRNT